MTFETRSHDVEEPNSISPIAVDVRDVGRWEIDLRNLRSGERIDFAIPKFDDDDDDVVAVTGELPASALPRRSPVARRVMGAMTAFVLVAGLGFAAFRGRATLQRSLANASARTRLAQTSTPVTVMPPPPVVVAPAPPAPPPATPAPAAVADAPPSLPTLSASDLPNAKGKLKAKTKHGKRAK